MLAFIVTDVIYNCFFIISTVLFYLARNQMGIKQRLPVLVLANTFAAIISGNISLVTLDIWTKSLPFPCWIRLAQQYLGAPMYTFTILLRVIFVTCSVAVQKVKLESSNKPNRIELILLKMIRFFKKNSNVSQASSTRNSIDVTNSRNSPEPDDCDSKADGKEDFRKSKAIGKLLTFDDSTALPIIGSYFAVEFVLLIITMFCWPISILMEPTCDIDQNIGRVVFQSISIAITPFILYQLKDFKDAIGLKNELIISNIACMVFFSLYSINFYLPTSHLGLRLGASVWNVILYVFNQFVMVIIPLVRAQLAVESTKTRSFEEKQYREMINILNDPKKKVLFSAQLAKQYCVENIKFYEAYVSFSKKNHAQPEKAQAELRAILKNFVAEGAPFELNIPGTLRKNFIAEVNAAPGVTGNANLEPIKNEVLKMMYLNTYPLYLKERQKANKGVRKSWSMNGKAKSNEASDNLQDSDVPSEITIVTPRSSAYVDKETAKKIRKDVMDQLGVPNSRGIKVSKPLASDASYASSKGSSIKE